MPETTEQTTGPTAAATVSPTPAPPPAPADAGTADAGPAQAEQEQDQLLSEIEDLVGSGGDGILDDDDGDETPAEGGDAPGAPAADGATLEGEGDDGAAEADAGEVDDQGVAAADEPQPEPEADAGPREEAEDRRHLEQAEAKAERQQRIAEINQQIKALRSKPVDERDPFDDANRLTELLAEKDQLRDVEMLELQAVSQRAAVQQSYEQHWTRFGHANPEIGAKQGRDTWERIFAEVAEQNGTSTPEQRIATNAIARDRFDARVRLLNAQRKGKPGGAAAAAAPAAKPGASGARPGPRKPPVTPGGASITPKPAQRPAAPAPRTTEEKLDAGVYGDLTAGLGV